jgi:hypothetical protein
MNILTSFNRITHILALIMVLFPVCCLEASTSTFTSTYDGKEYHWVITLVQPEISQKAGYFDEYVDISFQVSQSRIRMEIFTKTELSLDWSKTIYISPDGSQIQEPVTQISVEYPDYTESEPWMDSRSTESSVLEFGQDYRIEIGIFPYNQYRTGENITDRGMEQNLFPDRRTSFLTASDPFLTSEYGHYIGISRAPVLSSSSSGTSSYYMSSETIINQMITNTLQSNETGLFGGNPLVYSGKSFSIQFTAETDGESLDYRFEFMIDVQEQ